MSRYQSLRVARVQQETPDCVSVWLEVPEDLKSTFAFKSGQYLNCRATLDGEEVRRSYSICSIPSDPYLVVAAKRVPGGKMSTYINNELKAGDSFEVMPPEGKFTLPENLPDDATLLFFAAGSGITPVISLIKYFLDTTREGQVVLFYTNKTSDSIIFRDQLEALKNEHMMRFTLYHVLTREVTGTELFSGRINAEKCAVFAKHFFNPAEVHTCFSCGPELHVQELTHALKELGMRDDQLKFELFGTTNSHVRPVEEEKVVLEGEDKMSRVTVRIDGHEVDLQINYLGNNVLDTAINSGMDIPYSCKGGVCSTCKAQVVEGEVYMDVHYGLEPDEIDAGVVLTCQSHPRSERLILDYDIL